MKAQWKVEIVEIESGEVVRTVTCKGGEHEADKVERGILRNLDTDRFCVGTVGPPLHVRIGKSKIVHSIAHDDPTGKAVCGTEVGNKGTIVSGAVDCQRCRGKVTHGGARPNAGRPVRGSEALDVQYMIRMSERQREALDAKAAACGLPSAAEVVRRWIDSDAPIGAS